VRYAYDALGRLVASANREAENRFMYDAVGQLVDERMAYAPGPVLLPGQEVEPIAAFTMTHAYDELGNRIQTILPNGRRIDTLRYGSGHWHGTLWQGKTLVDVERDHLHRETVRELGNASERLTERRSYDPQSRLSSFSLDKGETRLRERRYGYDSTGNLVHIHDEFIGSTRYTYDPLGQLLSAVQPGLIETFAFDPAGNLLDSETTPSGIDTRRILRELDEQPGAGTKSRRFAKVTHNLLRQYSGYNYEYDVQGNTVVKRARATNSANDEGTLTFEYDADNRLTVAVRTTLSSRMVARYSYDAFGRRIGKQVIEQDWGTMETRPPIGHSHRGRLTLFVWDGDVMVQEIDTGTTLTFVYEPNSFVPLARISSTEGIDQYPPYTTNLTNTSESQLWSGRNPDDQVQMCPILLAKPREQFRHDHGRGPTHMPESDARTDDVLYYQCDHLGTPTELRDADGTVAWAVRYRAWGKVYKELESIVEQPLRFQGQYQDKETGLFYNRHRYYDADIARFLTQDPIGLVGGLNGYQYVHNPVGWTDPTGLTAAKLKASLAADFRPVSPGQTPHHIVQETCGKNTHVKKSRKILERQGVDIDDAPNGARLWGTNPSQELKGGHPGKVKSALTGNRHSGPHIHGHLNDKLIYQILRNSERRGIDVSVILRDIGARMENGSWKYTFACCCDK
jgi:RHS repeat-associated protein